MITSLPKGCGRSVNMSSEFRKAILGNNEAQDLSTRHKLLNAEQAIVYQRQLGGADYHQIYFGFPLEDAIRRGYKISMKGFFEMAPAHQLLDTAQTTRRLLLDVLNYQGLWNAADLFTGSGQAAWAYARRKFSATAVELDEFTHQYAKDNLALAGVGDRVNSIHGDALDFLAKAREKSHAAVFLDPPWHGRYQYDLTKPFSLSDTEPDTRELVQKSLRVAPLVAVKVPQNISQGQVRLLGEQLNCNTYIRFQDTPSYDPKFNLATIYFIEGGSQFSTERVVIPIPEPDSSLLMPLKTKSIQAKPYKSDGVRICIMRRIKPEFVFDIWMPVLAPSTELLEAYHNRIIDWDEYERRYTKEVLDKQETYLRIVIDMARVDNVTLLCIEETPAECHRRLVASRIKSMEPRLEVTFL